ncbi:UNVERIFIED_CONTAM: hypothetical protein NCL1_30314 [Trichonephila clavipes]
MKRLPLETKNINFMDGKRRVICYVAIDKSVIPYFLVTIIIIILTIIKKRMEENLINCLFKRIRHSSTWKSNSTEFNSFLKLLFNSKGTIKFSEFGASRVGTGTEPCFGFTLGVHRPDQSVYGHAGKNLVNFL